MLVPVTAGSIRPGPARGGRGSRGRAVLDVDGPIRWGAVSDLLPASRVCPGQRRVAILAVDELLGRVPDGRK